MPRQGLGQCSPLQTWVQQVGLWQAGTGQPLLSATGNATFLPGAPHLWPRAGRYRLALQDAHHTGAGDKGGASEDRDLPASPGPSCPAGSPCLPGLLAHQLSHSPAITSLSSRLSQDLSPDPTEWLWFSRIPKGAGAGRALQMAQPITNPAQSSTPLSPPMGTRVLVDGGHRSPRHQPWDTGVAHSHLQSQAGPCGQSGRGQLGGHCCAWGVVGGDIDPCLWTGTGSSTGPVGAWGGAHKGHPGTAGLRVTHSWAAGSLSSLAGT